MTTTTEPISPSTDTGWGRLTNTISRHVDQISTASPRWLQAAAGMIDLLETRGDQVTTHDLEHATAWVEQCARIGHGPAGPYLPDWMREQGNE